MNTCSEGYAHRPQATACEISAAAGGSNADGANAALGGAGGAADGDSALPRADGTVDCYADPSVCDAYEYGYCNAIVEAAAGLWRCLSGCLTDADCGDGRICVCDGPSRTGGICVASACSTDADCGAGLLCASLEPVCSVNVSKPNWLEFACQTAQDECATNADCEQPSAGQWLCAKDGNKRSCTLTLCGRPFLIHAQARVAPLANSTLWHPAQAGTPQVGHLSLGERAMFAEHWTRMAQLEHASIAAFARFNLQLLALGAPPALVESCTQALADETVHAKLCFGIASVYAGRAIGPGPLDISGSLAACSLIDVVDLVLVEGCFGETSAALEALESAQTEADPVVASAYRQIARDEQRHAELAFRFVRWAVERDPAAVRERIQRALQTDLACTRAAREITVACLSALLAPALAV